MKKSLTLTVRSQETWNWLKTGTLKKEIEGMLMAAQMQALRKSYKKSNVDKQIVSPVYVACAEKERKQSAV